MVLYELQKSQPYSFLQENLLSVYFSLCKTCNSPRGAKTDPRGKARIFSKLSTTYCFVQNIRTLSHVVTYKNLKKSVI